MGAPDTGRSGARADQGGTGGSGRNGQIRAVLFPQLGNLRGRRNARAAGRGKGVSAAGDGPALQEIKVNPVRDSGTAGQRASGLGREGIGTCGRARVSGHLGAGPGRTGCQDTFV